MLALVRFLAQFSAAVPFSFAPAGDSSSVQQWQCSEDVEEFFYIYLVLCRPSVVFFPNTRVLSLQAGFASVDDKISLSYDEDVSFSARTFDAQSEKRSDFTQNSKF